MRITVNGTGEQVRDGLDLAGLVTDRDLNAETIVIEHNGRIVPREEWKTAALAAGDRVEIVGFVGGG